MRRAEADGDPKLCGKEMSILQELCPTMRATCAVTANDGLAQASDWMTDSANVTTAS